nr:hypothetical protein [Lachnospiraceae bacterium]
MAKKKKIVTYGLRYSDYAKQRDLFALRNNGDIEIIAETGFNAEDPEIFFKRMTLDEALACAPDMIIDCSGRPEESSAAFRDRGIKPEDISVLTGDHYEKIKEGQLEILKEVVKASDEQICDRTWLRSKLNAYGFFPFFKLAKEPEPGVVWSTRGILQVPEEFTDLCLRIARLTVENAIEIGVARGASSYILAALL